MHKRQNNKESKSYVQGLRRFGNALPRGVKGILKKNGYLYSEIINKWSFLVGKEISDCTYPKMIRILKDGTNRILVICVKRGNEINVEYSKKEIINKINSYFGYNLIKEIKLESLNSEVIKEKKNKSNDFLKGTRRKIEEIKDEGIRNSLTKLLETIKNA
tara:strand:- start:1503 stop:1982 length:480 start_codon:yes stop_codon:yes gene_type:complete